MRLFHFSENPDIGRFVPRPVLVPSARGPGRDWLNGPLVWAIDEPHQAMYLFPRDCPRILLWPTERTTAEDRRAWWGKSDCRIIAHIEASWLSRLMSTPICRYEFTLDGFESLDDAGMWVSRRTVDPLGMEVIENLPAALAEAGAELRVMPSLAPLRGAWDTTLHASGIRLRNAEGWAAA